MVALRQTRPPTVHDGTGRGVLSRTHSWRGYAGYEFDPGLWYASSLISGTVPPRAMWHVRNRMLDSETGRWTRRDPVGYVDGMGLYEYVGGMAIRSQDARGTTSDDAWRPLWIPLLPGGPSCGIPLVIPHSPYYPGGGPDGKPVGPWGFWESDCANVFPAGGGSACIDCCDTNYKAEAGGCKTSFTRGVQDNCLLDNDPLSGPVYSCECFQKYKRAYEECRDNSRRKRSNCVSNCNSVYKPSPFDAPRPIRNFMDEPWDFPCMSTPNKTFPDPVISPTIDNPWLPDGKPLPSTKPPVSPTKPPTIEPGRKLNPLPVRK